ncbi:hypothetical protein TeGR_g7979 [Tetraparma gracilis]|jgi:hypothetical protein|uniref:Uncharacterized protein n=1 Tax=Tetraparma gracilis TaxID=2962635 RepID=A0ABQ6MER0_9STRA|nr:hypothetical protein TeGR_g7979 [Tetraparma gracilis]
MQLLALFCLVAVLAVSQGFAPAPTFGRPTAGFELGLKKDAKMTKPFWQQKPEGVNIRKVEDSQIWIEDEASGKPQFTLRGIIEKAGQWGKYTPGAEGLSKLQKGKGNSGQ